MIVFIILFIIIIVYCCSKQKESFKCDIPTLDTYIPDPYLLNIRKYLERLNLNLEKPIFNGTCQVQSYNEYDIEPRLKQQILSYIQPYISKLNNELHIHIVITKLLNIDVEEDVKGNKRYIVDLFTYETNHFYSCRFILDFIVYIDKEKQLNTFVFSNAKITNNKLSGDNIHSLTTNFVETPSNREKNNCGLLGYDTSKLEFTHYKKQNYIQEDRIGLKSKYRNSWILPKQMTCKGQGWDGKTYNHYPSCVKKYASSNMFFPYINPTVTGIPNTKDGDLFSITRGIIKPLSRT